MAYRYDPAMAAKFAQIDAENPEVWKLYVKFTFEMIKRGFSHYSSRAVIHRVRWETDTPLEDDTEFKINDHYTPYYARKFHKVYPAHDGFFRNRQSRADGGPDDDGVAPEPDEPDPAPPTGPIGACGRFVALPYPHGFKACGKPTLPGRDRCADHAG